jgi:hypothetical protein
VLPGEEAFKLPGPNECYISRSLSN